MPLPLLHRLRRRAGAGPVVLRARGPVDPATAWQRYDRVALWPAWSPHLLRVRCDHATLTAGARGRVHGPLGVTARFVVLAVDAPGRRWTWRVTSGPLTVVLEHGVDAAAGGGARTWLRMEGPLPALLGYAPLAWWSLHRLVTLPALRHPGVDPVTGP
ncbi:SRPBCC family protein [Cellulomonas endophytica]|uniref:SRPBCC family protein n=1 Tax=Cellulomonas endophytica TaxID=2494735 RepID=UPI00196AB3A7|nr:SRPBCC family protein [Cellulomonas endophytica]